MLGEKKLAPTMPYAMCGEEHRGGISELQDSIGGQMNKKKRKKNRCRAEPHATESLQRMYTQVNRYPPCLPSHFISSPVPPGFQLRFFHPVRLSSAFLPCFSSSMLTTSLLPTLLNLLTCFSSSISLLFLVEQFLVSCPLHGPS
jgi:hypothetical protein